MKVILIAIYCFAVPVFCLVDEDITVLLDRANELAARGHRVLDPLNQNYNFSRGRLIYPANYELQRLEICREELKNFTQFSLPRTPEIDETQEELLYRENTLGQELDLIEDIWTHYNANNLETNELQQYGEKIKLQIKAELELHKIDAGNEQELKKNAGEIEYKLARIENATRHPDPDVFDQDSIDLVELFRSVREIFEQINP